MHDRSEVPRASRRRAGAIDDEREKKQKTTIAKCTPATRVGVVAEVRDECLVHDPVAYARLLDDVREVVCVTHGLRLRRRDVALVRKAGPRGAGWGADWGRSVEDRLSFCFFGKGVSNVRQKHPDSSHIRKKCKDGGKMG